MEKLCIEDVFFRFILANLVDAFILPPLFLGCSWFFISEFPGVLFNNGRIVGLTKSYETYALCKLSLILEQGFYIS